MDIPLSAKDSGYENWTRLQLGGTTIENGPRGVEPEVPQTIPRIALGGIAASLLIGWGCRHLPQAKWLFGGLALLDLGLLIAAGKRFADYGRQRNLYEQERRELPQIYKEIAEHLDGELDKEFRSHSLIYKESIQGASELRLAPIWDTEHLPKKVSSLDNPKPPYATWAIRTLYEYSKKEPLEVDSVTLVANVAGGERLDNLLNLIYPERTQSPPKLSETFYIWRA
ncbi:MAG: hypothetical protein AB7F31_05795 [Parachlamydiales bacterium]